MTLKVIEVCIVQLILISLLGFITFSLLKFRRTIRYERKISRYTVKGNQDNSVSLGEQLFAIAKRIIDFITISLTKSAVVKERAKKYDKYDHAIVRNPISSYRIIAIKTFISLEFAALYIFSSLISMHFDFMFLLLGMIISFYIYNIYLSIHEKKRTKDIEGDLLKAIIIMNNAFKSGYNITQAIDYVVKDLNGAISDEFRRIGDDLKYGLETKEVFDRFYNRVQIEDAKLITSSLSLLNLTGGNLVGIFNSIEKSITNQKRLRDELNAMTSSSNLVYRILLVMPFALIGMILLLNPTYFNPLFANPLGYLIVLIVIGLFVLYIFVIRKILRVDV